MDLAAMAIFARVAEAKSFSEAARRLKISKSVVSKHVTDLERSMGVRLLNRTTRSVSLTEIGQEFYQRCAEIVAAAEEAERVAMNEQSEVRGTLKVTASVSFGVLQLAPALPDLRERHPHLSIELTLTSRVVSLVEEGYDCSVLIEREPTPGVVARRIGPAERCICASPGYLEKRGVPRSLEELNDHECILFTGVGSPRKWCFRGPGGEVGVRVNGKLSINNYNAIRAAAVRNAGIALLPAHVAAAELRAGRLVPILPDYTPVPSTICVVYPANRHVASKVRAFVDVMVQRFGSERDWNGCGDDPASG
jgi:DNA-binding transcriptional LysR family regulator